MHLSKQSKNLNQDITTVKGVWIPDLHCTKTSNFVKILWGVLSLKLSCRYLDNPMKHSLFSYTAINLNQMIPLAYLITKFAPHYLNLNNQHPNTSKQTVQL